MTPATSMWVVESDSDAGRGGSHPLPVAQMLPEDVNRAPTLQSSAPVGEPMPMGYMPPIRRRRFWGPLLAIALGLVAMAVAGALIVRSMRNADLGIDLGLSFPNPRTDLLLWAPAETDGVIGLDIGMLSANKFFEELMASGNQRDFRDAGFDMGDVETAIVALRQEAGGKMSDLLILRLKHMYDPNPAIRAGKAKVLKAGNLKYMSLNDRIWLYNPTDKIVLLSEKEQLLLDAIQGKTTNIRFGQDLLKAVSATSGPFWYAAAGPAAQPNSGFDFRKSLEFGRPVRAWPLVKTSRVSTKVTRDAIEATGEDEYSTPEKAKLAKEYHEANLDAFLSNELFKRKATDPEVHLLRTVLDTYSTRVDGTKLVSTFVIPKPELDRFVKRVRRNH